MRIVSYRKTAVALVALVVVSGAVVACTVMDDVSPITRSDVGIAATPEPFLNDVRINIHAMGEKDMGGYSLPQTQLSLSGSVNYPDAAAATPFGPHLITVRLENCWAEDPSIDRDDYRVFAHAKSYIRCWYAGGGSEYGVFIEQMKADTILIVKGRYLAECGNIPDCTPYGPLQSIVSVSLDSPEIVSRTEPIGW